MLLLLALLLMKFLVFLSIESLTEVITLPLLKSELSLRLSDDFEFFRFDKDLFCDEYTRCEGVYFCASY